VNDESAGIGQAATLESSCRFVRFARRLARQEGHRIVSLLATLVVGSALVASSACGKSLPDPVTKANGIATIPIDGLVFAIPEKTWLKGYSRNSTDGLVHGFRLHAVAPNVEPWSPENNEQMYKVPGWGTRIEVSVTSRDGRLPVKQTAAWIEENLRGCKFGASRIHEANNIRFCETEYEKRFASVDGDHFRYQLVCASEKMKASEKFPAHQECRMYFFYLDKLNVDLVFSERYLKLAFDIARAVEAKLIEFDKTPQHIE